MELTLFLDHQCNLRCRYCYNGQKFTRALDFDVIQKSVEIALNPTPSHLEVSFFGGEPLLHPDLVRKTIDYVEARVQKLPEPRLRPFYVMNTNGTLFNDETLACMAPRERFGIYISLDGPERLHDRHRIDGSGRGSFGKVIEGLECLRSAGFGYQLVAVIGTDNARDMGEIAQTLFDLNPAKVVFSPNYRDEWTEDAVGRFREGLRDACEVWMNLFRAGRAVAFEPMQSKILTHLKGGMPCPKRCQLAAQAFAVAPSGNLYPCGQMVGEDTSSDLVIGHADRGLDRKRLAELQNAKDQVEETCAPCALRDRCQSHCGCRHVALTGRLGQITAALCELETAFIEEADRVAETLVSESCASFVSHFYQQNWGQAKGSRLTQLRRAKG